MAKKVLLICTLYSWYSEYSMVIVNSIFINFMRKVSSSIHPVISQVAPSQTQPYLLVRLLPNQTITAGFSYCFSFLRSCRIQISYVVNTETYFKRISVYSILNLLINKNLISF